MTPRGAHRRARNQRRRANRREREVARAVERALDPNHSFTVISDEMDAAAARLRQRMVQTIFKPGHNVVITNLDDDS